MLHATSVSLFRLWSYIYSKHTSTLPAYDISALYYCISNLQRGSKKQYLLKKLQLTTWKLLFFNIESRSMFNTPLVNKYLVVTRLLAILLEKALLFCCTPYLLTPAIRRATWSQFDSFTTDKTYSGSKAASGFEFNTHFLPIQLITIWFGVFLGRPACFQSLLITISSHRSLLIKKLFQMHLVTLRQVRSLLMLVLSHGFLGIF